MNPSIQAIGTAVPPFKTQQNDLIEFMTRHMGQDRRTARKIKALFNLSGIESRYSVIPDFGSKEEDYKFFPSNAALEPFPSTQKRMEQYQHHAKVLAEEAAKKCFSESSVTPKDVTHLITVSCTGMYAPGLDIELIDHLGLSTNTERTAINFMGCYAAFNALKVAKNIVKAHPESQVLIVAVELCSLHFQKESTDDTLLSNALFGDGAAAVLVNAPSSKGEKRLVFQNFHNDLALQGKNEMGWFIKDIGFEMKLSGEVPEIIKKGIKELTDRLLNKIKLKVSDVDYFAIHPGGRKILEVIEQTLNIAKADNAPAHRVMSQFGNMSSPTVLFVLKDIMSKLTSSDHGKKVLSFAFGPGLTLESMLLEVQS